MSFTIGEGTMLTPIDFSDRAAVDRALHGIGESGGALFSNLPDNLKDDLNQSPVQWASRVVGSFLPTIADAFPHAIPASYGIEARRQTHHSGDHITAHPDPSYRDPFFFGETLEGEAEFRYTHNGQSYWFKAAPDTLWTLAGPSISGERILHELGAPANGDRLVTIGSVVSKNNLKKQ